MNEAKARVNPNGEPALWFGMIGAPVIWFAQLLLNWSLTEGGCSPSFSGLFGLSGIRIVILLGGLVAATVAIAAGIVSYRGWQQDDQAGPRQFMAVGGMLLSTFFTLAIVFTTFPVFILPCE